jgi:hypothetical protein
VIAEAEYVALTTFRRDGSAVTTPVWAASAGARLYVYTPERSGKVRRIRHTDRVELAQCDFSGHPRGAVVTGRARILPRGELRRATAALRAKYGRKFRWFTVVTLIGRPRRAGGAPVGIEITLDRSNDESAG